ncbi:hypothetical protein B4U37_21610 (plasmid) [Sutcliffiella horikoshii]|uniref:Transposase n=1 Tax=Sutcliffiella horikoshii TaxID=79883 RepID=A0ABN4ZNF2_9BACI|nr:hypothetical protein [Sutcliffiella horikoshii]ART78711.1 hypothetical protein B4U37_21610 [Sutcliffiella horikoshii]
MKKGYVGFMCGFKGGCSGSTKVFGYVTGNVNCKVIEQFIGDLEGEKVLAADKIRKRNIF